MGFEMKHGTKLREFSQQQLSCSFSFSDVLNSLLSTSLLLKHRIARTTINLCICFPPLFVSRLIHSV